MMQMLAVGHFTMAVHSTTGTDWIGGYATYANGTISFGPGNHDDTLVTRTIRVTSATVTGRRGPFLTGVGRTVVVGLASATGETSVAFPARQVKAILELLHRQ